MGSDRNKKSAGRINSWAKAIKGLGTEQQLLMLSKSLAQASKSNISFGFRAESDPYGDKWAPRASGETSKALLVDTGRLKRSWTSTVRSSGFKIRSAVEYAKHHQFGTRRMVARKMVPDSGALPPEWSREFNHMARRWQKRVLNKVKRMCK